MKNKKILKIIFTVLVTLLAINVGLIVVVGSHPATSGGQGLIGGRVVFLDIGQGDAILIQSASGQNILIDGGSTRQITYKLDQYLSPLNRQIDLMVLSHPDPDHLNGLIEVTQRYQVKQIYDTGVNDPDINYQAWQTMIAQNNIPLHFVVGPEKLLIDDTMSLNFIWPWTNLIGHDLKDDNPGSMVIEMNFNNHNFLFTGDIPVEVETQLIPYLKASKIEVLKVAHHGSKYSSGIDFLRAIAPAYAVIPVGPNKFGHPSFRALTNLAKTNTKILRTDERGDIIFIINNNQLNIKTTK